MCTPSIHNVPIVTLRLLSPVPAQHATTTLYSIFFYKVYRSIIGSKKPLIGALGMLIRSIKDVLKALFNLALYPLNCLHTFRSLSITKKVYSRFII
ncbi:hypothetical protein MUK42_05821 [Musa troglodytarum]|uniref:Uncharacterized protein n=1 Tax=Musa troglodytarum TaxID=320322 RepID=A0A9E7EGB6_9LILI|nr:hypothetical protein MUK42_05821 [Musa troglodytarum]